MAVELWRPRRGWPRSPFRELERFEREMAEMFGPLARRFPWSWDERGWTPAVDMIDRKDEVVVKADLPGLEDRDIEVSVQDGMLTIRGQRRQEKVETGEEYYYCERVAGAFARTLALPAGVDQDRIRATFTKGVLEIHLPKTKEAKGRKIDIKVE